MKKTIKILLVMMILITAFTVTVNAASSSGINPEKFTGDGGYNTDSIEGLGNKIIQIVSVIGSIVSVVVLVVLGLKYMMGSAEEKAEYKKTLLPYLIGAALVFAASSIAGIVFNFTSSL